jgi:hypothetical protein
VDRQCPSCGGFCKKSGCERENVKPKEWVGLTDEQFNRIPELYVIPPHHVEMVVRAIEAKLKEKNGG